MAVMNDGIPWQNPNEYGSLLVTIDQHGSQFVHEGLGAPIIPKNSLRLYFCDGMVMAIATTIDDDPLSLLMKKISLGFQHQDRFLSRWVAIDTRLNQY